MSIKTHILNASGELTPYQDSIQKTIHQTIKKVRLEIPLDKIDIVIKKADKPANLKNLNGVGGYCPSGSFVQLDIDTNHPAFGKNIKNIIEKPLIHELNHAARRQVGIEIDKRSFWECVFSEGLADVFVYKITGNFPKWSIEVKSNKKRLVKKLQKIANDKTTLQNYKDWFIEGSKKQKIPQWTGYALGDEVVKNFIEKNPKRTMASIINKPASQIVPAKKMKEYIFFN